MNEVRYLISDAAKKVDVESHVLRYWEDELELQIPRNDMGHRYYTDYHIRLFRQIKDLKEKGYQLKAIKNALNRMAGVMEEIIITEDYMEEDMKAAWKESRGRQGMAKEKARAEGRNRILKDEKAEEDIKGGRKEPEEIEDEADRGGHEKPGERDSQHSGSPMGGEKQETENAGDGAGEASDLKLVAEQSQLEDAITGAEKMAQFQSIMNHVIGQAIEASMEKISREISENVTEAVSENVSDQVTDRVMKEMEYLMRVSDERQEERFKQLDETIRAYQKNGKSRAEAAATKIPFFKKRKFGRSGKRLF